jgi:murein DD-endopeptidase MepM/ murein hydrolase activator NlpD
VSERKPSPPSDKLTVVVIPGHGGSMFQWRISGFSLLILLGLAGALLGGAAFVLGRDLKQRHDLARAAELKQANLRVAADLVRGREALMRVAKLETELRRMLKFKTERALLKGQAIGGPTDEDVKKLAELLEAAPEEAVRDVERSMVDLMQAAREREKKFDEIKRYVRKRSTLLASRPTVWPVRGWVSSGFGDRSNPVTGKGGFHSGVDIANDQGTPIRATADGTVSFAGWEGGYGKLVVLNHGNGFSTYYGHLSEIKVGVGQKVVRGQVLGNMGATGNTTGPHLHYEIRLYGASVDPLKYMED